MSVEWWSTLHQPASITISNKPAIDLVMLYPLFGSMIGFAGIVTCLVILSSKLQIFKRERNKSWVKNYA
jgi:heme exporter protein C